MSQNDFNLANQGFPSMRADMNVALQALASNSSGLLTPSTTYAYQWWYDETTNILKLRNSLNSAWIPVFTFDQAADKLQGLTVGGDLVANSTSSGDYVRMYGGSGTGKWDIYGNGANLRIGDNESAGHVQFDTNVGIGTSSPTRQMSVENTLANGGGSIGITSSDSSTSGSLGTIHFGNSTDSSLASIDGLADGSTSAGALLFKTEADGGAIEERMRIDSSGDVYVGKTGGNSTVQGSVLYNNGQIYATASGSQAMLLTRKTSNGEIILFYREGTNVGNISVTGTSTSYNSPSDYRLKTDIQPMTGATERVQALNPVNFEWLADGTRVDGFIAHEAQGVVPECVTGERDAMKDEEYEITPAVYEDVVVEAVEAVEATYDEEGLLLTEGTEGTPERTERRIVSEAVMATSSVPDYQGIDQGKIIPLLTAALKESIEAIASLKSRVEALEG